MMTCKDDPVQNPVHLALRFIPNGMSLQLQVLVCAAFQQNIVLALVAVVRREARRHQPDQPRPRLLPLTPAPKSQGSERDDYLSEPIE
jgi:hypothetical protein